ncbi:peptidoglycan-binding protein [Aminobacter sp. DSM 101952]|uniref:N-acetylmuramidase domain-containing protein n=1 Tax=Aminobacter sp. DSM 101952 TaxID=2735891 RepID=UPI0006F70F30|nr:N-acetylmuramidase domain-containing protein [Aminobacter sp. DSM 101952]KQU65017.1 peptidoglycan-binding protein [Aminobacter sp. DSM 101952]
MFSKQTADEIEKAASEFGLEPAALLAIAEIESAGQVFARVDGRNEPLIRFEGHYFDRRLSDDRQARARAAGLASPTAGAVANPRGQAARWQMLEQAAGIDHQAAHESTSWGLGQVMGAHWLWLGFDNVDGLVAEARSGAAGQARLMARYINKAGLKDALNGHDWEAVGHGYNGPGFRKNNYHTKLAEAYRRQIDGPAPGDLTMQVGSRGELVTELQETLVALGYPVDTDGIYGPGTASAVRTFQAEHGLAADGIAGERTQGAIRTALQPATGGLWPALRSWLAGIFGRS